MLQNHLFNQLNKIETSTTLKNLNKNEKTIKR